MTINPADLVAVRSYVHGRTGLPNNELGIQGDDAHAASGGYHIGGSLVPSSDYSRRESARDRAITDTAASAFDLGLWGDGKVFRAVTLYLVALAKSGDPRMRDVREIIYTPDGQTVHRWDRLGIRTSGDTSHLKHTHTSFFRDSEGRRDRPDNFLGALQEAFAAQEADVEQTDRLIHPPAADPGRDVGWALTDLSQMRDGLVLPAQTVKDRGVPTPAADSWLGQLRADVAELKARPPVDPAAVAALLAPQLPTASDIVDELIRRAATGPTP